MGWTISKSGRTRRWPCREPRASRCCRRRSSMVPTARKSGATPAISTGRAPRLLSFFRKPGPAQKAEQPPVDRREAKHDEGKAAEIAGVQALAQEQAAEQDRGRRHQDRNQQGIACARSL